MPISFLSPRSSPELTLDLMRFYCDLCKAIKEHHGEASLRRIAKQDLDMHPAELSRRLVLLEKSLKLHERFGEGARLVNRAVGRGPAYLTRRGEYFYEKIRKYVNHYEELLGGRQDKRIRLGLTNWSLLNIIAPLMRGRGLKYTTSCLDQTELLGGKVLARLDIDELDYNDILEKIERGDLDIGFGPLPDNAESFSRIRFHQVGCPISMVRLSWPSQRNFVPEGLVVVRSSIHPGIKWSQLKEIPGIANLPIHYVPHYLTVLTYIGMSAGRHTIGILPDYGWLLRYAFRRFGLECLPLPTLGTFQMALYLPHSIKKSKYIECFCRMVEKEMEREEKVLSQSSQTSSEATLPFPKSLNTFKYLYYETFEDPHRITFRQAKIKWSESVDFIKGKSFHFPITERVSTNYSATEFLEEIEQQDESVRQYDLLGTLGLKMATWVANSCDEQNEQFVAAFNQCIPVPLDNPSATLFPTPKGDHLALLGTWIGFDQKGKPTVGTAVLSNHSISQTQGQRLFPIGARKIAV